MKSILKRTGATFSIVVLFALCAAAQQSAETAKKLDSGYVLGPDDQIVIHAIDSPEISDKPFLIGMNGNITLPLIGRVQAGVLLRGFDIGLGSKYFLGILLTRWLLSALLGRSVANYTLRVVQSFPD